MFEYKIFIGFLENAIKYNVPNGSIKINTSISNESFILSITDSGAGISKEDSVKILNKLFHRSDTARQMNLNGMGIGLSVAKAIIQAHHGTIKIDSERENHGTTVTVTIPIDYLKIDTDSRS